MQINAHVMLQIPLTMFVLQRIPERPLEAAIKGMLPKGRLGRKLFTHLKVFKGTRHPHGAQQATDITNRINEKFNNDSPTKGL